MQQSITGEKGNSHGRFKKALPLFNLQFMRLRKDYIKGKPYFIESVRKNHSP